MGEEVNRESLLVADGLRDPFRLHKPLINAVGQPVQVRAVRVADDPPQQLLVNRGELLHGADPEVGELGLRRGPDTPQ